MLDFIENIVGKERIPNKEKNKDDWELYKLNKRAAYLHLLSFVSQIGLYYYLDSTGKNNYNLRINENVDGLKGFPEGEGIAMKKKETDYKKEIKEKLKVDLEKEIKENFPYYENNIKLKKYG